MYAELWKIAAFEQNLKKSE